jgi:hypothetical protein
MQRRKTRSQDGAAGPTGYEVGYGKPPIHGQFRPGQSGNPAGRRKGVRNLETDVKRMLATPVKVKEGGRTRTRSTQEVVLMLLREKVLKDNPRALDRFLELAIRFSDQDAEVGLAQPLPDEDKAILTAWLNDHMAAGTSESQAARKSPPCNLLPHRTIGHADE